MILRRFGVEASYEDVHRELGTPPSGASMLSLRELARRRGLACEGWRLTPAEIDTMPLPALVLLRRSHYAVVEDRAASGAIVLVDPSFGRLTLSRRKFVSLWTGETLLFAQPGAAGAPPGTLLSFGRRIR
jgi:ABC-type bacteriocin/lantibiotic exporter with double-glycine peptidase domain